MNTPMNTIITTSTSIITKLIAAVVKNMAIHTAMIINTIMNMAKKKSLL